MAEFTLVELHFEDGPSLSLGNLSSAFANDDGDGVPTDADAETETETDGVGAVDVESDGRPGAGKWIAVLLGLALLVAAAAAAKKFAGEPPEELSEIDEFAEA